MREIPAKEEEREAMPVEEGPTRIEVNRVNVPKKLLVEKRNRDPSCNYKPEVFLPLLSPPLVLVVVGRVVRIPLAMRVLVKKY